MRNYEYDSDYENYGNDDAYGSWDSEREIWDALTDGQYGDMPEGFDGDYSFLGY